MSNLTIKIKSGQSEILYEQPTENTNYGIMRESSGGYSRAENIVSIVKSMCEACSAMESKRIGEL